MTQRITPTSTLAELVIEVPGRAWVLERAGLRTRLDEHPLPDDACASYTALHGSIRELIHDTHDHVFKENHVLFPAVIEREQRLVNA